MKTGMIAPGKRSGRLTLLALHPLFALTGAAVAATGPLLPSLARSFHLSDSQSGTLLFWVFAGMAAGALLCHGNYARIITLGLASMTISCFWFPLVPGPILYPFAFCFGVSVSLPMTAVNLFAGSNFPRQRAAVLTGLNFTWSLGALAAPLLISRLLAIASWHAVYFCLSGLAALAAVAAALTLDDVAETRQDAPPARRIINLGMIVLFSTFFFLEVGVECTVSSWISTYLVRELSMAASVAAAATAIYWAGFLASRGFSPAILAHIRPEILLRVALLSALGSASLLVVLRSRFLLEAAIFCLGMALAPIFPVALAGFFDRALHSSDSRFVLAFSGFGGSVIPWAVGSISQQTGSLRAGLSSVPVVLFFMVGMLPLLLRTPKAKPSSMLPVNSGR